MVEDFPAPYWLQTDFGFVDNMLIIAMAIEFSKRSIEIALHGIDRPARLHGEGFSCKQVVKLTMSIALAIIIDYRQILV